MRYSCAPATPCRVQFESEQRFSHGWLIDLSRSGAGLSLDMPLVARQAVILEISNPQTNEKMELPARAAHSTRQINGDWLVGFEFDTPLTDEKLDELL